MKRPNFRHFLKLCLILTFVAAVCALPKPVSAASKTQTEKIIAAGRKMIGKKNYKGRCQKFVRICYEAGGVYANGYATTAKQAWKKWKRSTRKDNIPIGATVYFTSSSGMGHVGIYTGNGKMIHAMSTVREEPISNYGWDRYLGWGYQGGKKPTGSTVESVDMDSNEQPVICSVSRSKKKIKLTWKKVSGADGYRVYRKTKGGSWKRLCTINKSTTLTYSDKKIKANTTYMYCVRSYEKVNSTAVFSRCSKTVNVEAVSEDKET